MELSREECCARLEMPAMGTRTFQYVVPHSSFLLQKGSSFSGNDEGQLHSVQIKFAKIHLNFQMMGMSYPLSLLRRIWVPI